MIGNEAVARGLYEGGLKVVSSYPGTPSTEITEFLSKYDDIYSEWAPNEKVAAEVCFGASVGGVRCACAMKHVGLNVAADPLFTLSYTGVRGGMVICVADDPGMHSSQNEQDSRHYAIGAKVPMLEPADSSECLEFAKKAFELSEEFDTPVLLRVCTRIAHGQSVVETGERVNIADKPYEKEPAKYIMMPGNAIKRHPFVEQRTEKIREFSEKCEFNRVEYGSSDLGIITSGACYQYVKEVFGNDVSVLKLGLVNPLPVDTIKDFASKVKRLVVIEELDPVIENHCLALGLKVEGKSLFGYLGELSQRKIAEAFGIEDKPFSALENPVPVRPPMMCAGCPHRGMYYVLAKNKVTVFGDIGCYTLGMVPPLRAADFLFCMGSSVSAGSGFAMVSDRPVVGFIGDSTFFHSGMTGLANAVFNKHDVLLVILDNGTTAMTGHQPNPGVCTSVLGEGCNHLDIESVVRGIGVTDVAKVKPFNMRGTLKTIEEMKARSGVRVIIAEEPCMLFARRTLKQNRPQVAEVATQGEEALKCLAELACPAFRRGGTAEAPVVSVDESQCSGCMVCLQVTPAIRARKRS